MSDAIEIRPFRGGDEQGIVDCYNKIFPVAEKHIPVRSLEEWRWKFHKCPAGLMLHMVADHEEQGIVGIYAGIPISIWVEGARAVAAQGVDFCVLPEFRRAGESGHGLFVDLGRAYIDRWHGEDEGQVLFTYGWPVPAWRNGRKHLGWMNIRDWDCTFMELNEDSKPRSAPRELETREVELFTEDVDDLFRAIRPTLGLATIRSQKYLNWRYTGRPHNRYRMYECREIATGKLRGICVYCPRSPVRKGAAFIVDWLHFDDDRDTMISMLSTLEQQAVRDGANMLASYWNHVDPRFAALQREGYRVAGTHYFLVLATAKYGTRFFRDHWYFTMGDSDLV